MIRAAVRVPEGVGDFFDLLYAQALQVVHRSSLHHLACAAGDVAAGRCGDGGEEGSAGAAHVPGGVFAQGFVGLVDDGLVALVFRFIEFSCQFFLRFRSFRCPVCHECSHLPPERLCHGECSLDFLRVEGVAQCVAGVCSGGDFAVEGGDGFGRVFAGQGCLFGVVGEGEVAAADAAMCGAAVVAARAEYDRQVDCMPHDVL